LEYSKGRYPKWRTPQLVAYSPETDTSTGERRAWKLASGVRRGARGKGRCESYLACGLPYFGVGIIASKADAEAVRQQIKRYVEETLKLTIAEEKSHIRHGKEGSMFLGYRIKTYTGNRIVKVKRGKRHFTSKSVNERLQLQIPPEKLVKFCHSKSYGNYTTGKTRQKSDLISLSDADTNVRSN
jgi:hypothetical protein